MQKQKTVHACNGILLNHEKRVTFQHLPPRYRILKHDASRETPTPKATFCVTLFMGDVQNGKPTERKPIAGPLGLHRKHGKGLPCGAGVSLWGSESLLEPGRGSGHMRW